MELKNKVVIITGGTKGLGREMALSFLKEGSSVVVCSRNKEELDKLETGILGVVADVTKEEEVENLAKTTLEKFGRIDIWVNNAGVWLPHASAEEFDMNKVRKMFDVNVFGLMNGSRVAIREMKKNKSGVIVNIISDSALAPRAESSMYCSSKWAARGFTDSIREDNEDILVISIYPGAIKTNIFGNNKPEFFDDFMKAGDVANKIVENLKRENPKEELMIIK